MSSFWRSIRQPSLHSALIAAALATGAMLVGLDAWRSLQSREATIAAQYAETANLAQSLAQHAYDTMESADTLVVALRERIEADGWSPENLARLQRSVMADAASLPRVHGLFIYDAAGDWVVNSLQTAHRSLHNANDPYFIYHRDHTDRGVHVGELLPCVAKTDCSWVIPVTRRVDGPDGRFAGIVLATVAVDYLTAFYETFDSGRHAMIGLVERSGIIAARVPGTVTMTGTDVSHGAVFGSLLPRSPVGNFRERSIVDGVVRLGSYHVVEGFPFVMTVARGLNDVLADWRRDALIHFGLSVVIAAGLVVLGSRFARQIGQRQQAEYRYRLLADNSSDAILCLDLDWRRLYVSPAFAALSGTSAKESTGERIGNFIHPDDMPVVSASLQLLRDGTSTEVTHEFRFRRNDGATLWVEARVRLVPAAGGQPAQFVANLRDVSVRKAAEDRVAALNAKLSEQAITDGLTGLSNRRHFDGELVQSWRRAARVNRPVSLLMIDVDRFKLYNDRYGHLEGDAALRAVASVAGTFARRDGDVVARYGGEEMAVLLPGSDAKGAADRAKLVRSGIEALALEHASNPPACVVTVSIGVATMMPGSADLAREPEALIVAADRALYQAKHSGRNRVVTAMPTSAMAAVKAD